MFAGLQVDSWMVVINHRTRSPTLFGSKIISSVFFTFKARSSESQQTNASYFRKDACTVKSTVNSSILKSVNESTEQVSTVADDTT